MQRTVAREHDIAGEALECLEGRHRVPVVEHRPEHLRTVDERGGVTGDECVTGDHRAGIGQVVVAVP